MIQIVLQPVIGPGKNSVFRHGPAQRRQRQRHGPTIPPKLRLLHIMLCDLPVLLPVPTPVFPALRITSALVDRDAKAQMDKLCAPLVKAPEEMIVIRSPDYRFYLLPQHSLPPVLFLQYGAVPGEAL